MEELGSGIASASSQRVSQIAAGEAHTLALTDAGEVFAWGRGFFGRLGTGRDTDEAVPVFVPIGLNTCQKKSFVGNTPSDSSQDRILKEQISSREDNDMGSKMIAVAAGAYHNLALADDGAVWSWGYNLYGQLGSDNENNSIPRPVTCWDEHNNAGIAIVDVASEDNNVSGRVEEDREEQCKPSKVVAVEAGGMMSCAIDQHGILWMWGHCPLPPREDNSESFSLVSSRRPQPVLGLQGLTVLKVACGNEHVLALVNRGGKGMEGPGQLVCYAWGSNTYGQLGLGDRDSRIFPQHVQTLNGQLAGTLADIACGALHSAVLTHSERWQAENSETMGSGIETFVAENQTVESDCQGTLLKRRSMCWTFGLGENGQLGHGKSESLAFPQVVQGLPEQEKLTAVACGLFHMGVLTETGAVWTWGMERGLGLCPGIGPPGTGAGDALYPMEVLGKSSALDAFHVEKLACGAAHTVVVGRGGSELWSWGRGQNGVLGTGCLVDNLLPCRVVWPPSCAGEENSREDKNGISQHDLAIELPIKSQLAKELTDAEIHFGVMETEKRLEVAQREIWTLTTELTAVKRYAASLHAALYGLPETSEVNQEPYVLQEWEKIIEEASYSDLVRFDEFYRRMRSRVKEVMLHKKMEKLCRQYMEVLQVDGQQSTDHIMPPMR